MRFATATATLSLIAAGLAAFTLTSPAAAEITTPTDGTVIRDAGPVTITEDRGGQYANLAAATTLNSGFLGRGCNGTGANRQKANATITVTRESDGEVVVSEFHETGNNALSLASANATGGFSATWDTTGAEPGVYRITSTANDRAKVGSATSQDCTPDTNTVLSDLTVEYRPWQNANFDDVLGNGKVRLNTNPREFQFTVGNKTSPVIAATPQEMSYYISPSSLTVLPADPEACAGNPFQCLPVGATLCEPAAGCQPGLVVINRQGADALSGVFDLDSGAFAAVATTGGQTRVLVSAGTELDELLNDLIDGTVANGQAVTGLDLLAVLSTSVEIPLFKSGSELDVIEVGVLHGLAYSQAVAAIDPVGLKLNAPFSINAGFIAHQVAAHSYSQADGPASVFTVTESPLVPNLPTLFSLPLGGLGSADILAPVPVPEPLNELTGDLLLVGGGPLVNIRGTYPAGTGSHTAGTGGLNGPNVDTAQGAPSGLPLWLPGESGAIADTGPIDFLGHAALFLDLPTICLLGTCLDTGSLLIGQGVTVFGDNPLGPLDALPLLWDTDNPVAAELNELTGNLALELIANPAVGQVLGAALGLLGGGTPDLDTVTGLLSDLGSFGELVNAVAETAGLEAVPGLEETLADLGSLIGTVPLDPDAGLGDPDAPGDPVSGLIGGLVGGVVGGLTGGLLNIV